MFLGCCAGHNGLRTSAVFEYSGIKIKYKENKALPRYQPFKKPYYLSNSRGVVVSTLLAY
jgi:hypothetical protein